MNKFLLGISSSFLAINLVIFCVALVDVKPILNFDWFFTYDFLFFPLFFYSIYILTKADKFKEISVNFTLIKRIGFVLLILTLLFFFANFFNEGVFFKGNEYFMIVEKTKSIKITPDSFFNNYRVHVLHKSSINIWFSYVSSIVLFLKHKSEK